MNHKNFFSYIQIRKNAMVQQLRLSQMSEAIAMSLPLPTLRLGRPSFVQFAAPAIRRPGKPTHRGIPDRWWAIDAVQGTLLVYTLDALFPFAPQAHWEEYDLAPSGLTIAQSEEHLKMWEIEIDELAPAFFQDELIEANKRRQLLDRAGVMFQPPILEQYRALAPDFFEWLEKE